MKVQTTAFVVLAASGKALGSWVDWFNKDATVTNTVTRTAHYCPCNGEVRVTPVAPATGVEIYTKTGAWDPAHTGGAGKTVTKAGPIVVVYTTAGTVTTKTGIVIELKPTHGAPGPVVTKTVWTGPQPTDNLAWIDWDEEDEENGGTLTRFHTKFTTVFGPAPTGDDHEPWADWVATSKSTRTKTKTDTTYIFSSSSSSSSSGGPISGSTTSSWTSYTGYPSSSSTSTSFSTSSTSTSSSIASPISGSTSSSSSTSSSTSFSSSVGPIGSSTTSSSLSTTSSTSFSSSVEPTGISTTSSSSSVSTLSTSTSTVQESSSTTTSALSTTTALTTTTSNLVTTSSVTTTTSAAGPTVTLDVRGLSYIDGILEAHNVHRRNHSAVDLTWSDSLASIAGTTAASCVYAHDTSTGGGGYGQNIGAGYTAAQVPAMIGNDMYNKEMPFYPLPFGVDNPDTSNFGAWGHFSQIVWKGTTQVGCATQFCSNLVNADFTHYFTVCNYYPPGNIGGAYSNVGAPLGEPITVILTN